MFEKETDVFLFKLENEKISSRYCRYNYGNFGFQILHLQAPGYPYRDFTLIQEQIKNVGKLVVTEGYFRKYIVRRFKRSIWRLFQADKKALVVVNAKVR